MVINETEKIGVNPSITTKIRKGKQVAHWMITSTKVVLFAKIDGSWSNLDPIKF